MCFYKPQMCLFLGLSLHLVLSTTYFHHGDLVKEEEEEKSGVVLLSWCISLPATWFMMPSMCGSFENVCMF